MISRTAFFGSLTLLLSLTGTSFGQSRRANYDESKVPQYTLPDPLVSQDGQKIVDPESWNKKRRPEILRLFETQMYGHTPEKALKVSWEVTSVDSKALGGKATRKEVSVY